MARPGVEIVSRDLPPPLSAPVGTGVWFAVGATEKGPEEPVEIRSMTKYTEVFGTRAGGALLYDSVETYFREGGGRVWISAVPTTPDVLQQVFDRGDTEKAEKQATKLEEAAEKEAEKEPEEPKPRTPSQLAFDATTAETALDRFTKSLGPGQVSVPGLSDAATQTALLEHARLTNRVAVLDGTETGDAAAQTALATTLKTLGDARYGALFAPYAVIPGLAPGTSRVVPMSAVMAGLIARNDLLHSPNVPAAGSNGQSWFATDVTMRYTDAEYTSMNDASVNAAKLIYGGVQAYGYRTLADQSTPSGKLWREFSNARLNMAIAAQAEAVAERYVFAQIDGRGLKIAEFGGELRSMLVPFYEAGSLYGSTPDEAFRVDVGSQVNTDETIAAGELHAVLMVKMSPFAEWVKIEIVKVATTQQLAAA